MNRSRPLSLPDYERTEGSLGPIIFTAIGLAFGIGVVLLVSAWLYQAHDRGAAWRRTHGPEYSFEHAPEERTGIKRDWLAQDQRVKERLKTYGWVDRAGGVVRIPIERAMERLASESVSPKPELPK